MHVVCVHVHVKPEQREAFIEASLENARSSVQEPGNLRFDVLQRLDDPNRFVLYEVYRDEVGMNAHKETAHYARWRDTVNPWMAEPREGVKYLSRFPESEEAWATRI
jgi:autoinducer 2-degrading protein